MKRCPICSTAIPEALVCAKCGHDFERDAGHDDHGQPLNASLNRVRRTERDLSEMIGIAKGMLADGVINEEEATYLRAWAGSHPDALQHWPVNVIFARLQQYFVDGPIDAVGRRALQSLLADLVGGTASILLGYDGATTLPLDDPAPTIGWGPNNVFVFTGRFAYGTRPDCAHEATARGSACESNVTQRTTFLVIGTFGSEDWKHSAYGLKVQKAVKLRAEGFPIRIVGEDHWANALALTACPAA